ncbi:MAG: DUF348 domain-containing protein, partial [Chloroflexi bacterium]
MKFARLLVLASFFFLLACQSATPSTVIIIDNGQTLTLQTNERVPSKLMDQAGITLNPNDRVLLNGLPVQPNLPITNHPITLQVRRAASLILSTPDGEQKLQSSAFTVGEALYEASIWLRAGDKVQPELSAPITNGMKVTVVSPRELTVSVDGKAVQIQSSARTVGEALAEAGI